MENPFKQKSKPSLHSVEESMRLREMALDFLKKNVQDFGHIESAHIMFLKDNEEAKNRHDYYLECQIPNPQVRMAFPRVHYVIVAHDPINNLLPDQFQRQLHHVFRHIPRNYQDLEKPSLLQHDIEEFEDVAIKFKSKELFQKERKIPSFRTLE